jgi:hypothetical protein
MHAYATQVKLERRRIVDDVMTAYVKWREASARVWDAYRCWGNAKQEDVSLAFRAYAAALDSEERACEIYADLIVQLDHLDQVRPQGRARSTRGDHK